jgi:vitamin B12 transporter
MKRFIFIGFIFALPFLLFSFTDDYNKVKTFYELNTTDQKNEQGFEIPNKQAPGYELKKSEPVKNRDLGEIVITARNIPELLSLVPKDIQIIKPKSENLYGENRIVDMLDNLPGIFINKTGVNDSIATVSIRGTGSKYTLVLLDGIPLNDFMTGGVDLSKIDNLNIGRIEIIKSGMSSIYGADASSGVINIITGEEEKYYLRTTGVYGTADYKKYSVSSNSKIFNVDYSVNYSEEKKGDYFPNSDLDKKIANAKVSFSNKGLINILLNGSYLKRTMGIPYNDFGPSIARQSDEDFSLGLIDVINLDFMTVKINGFIKSADLKYDNPDIYYPVHSRHIKKEYQAALTGIYEEGQWLSLLAGLEWNLKDLDSTDIGKKNTTNNAGLINATVKLFEEKLIANGGVRFDLNSEYGNFNSENITVSYKFPDKLEIFGSIDKSFSAPTFGNLYWPAFTYDFMGTTYIYTSNPDLKPEQMMTYEIGLKKSIDKMDETISVYYKDITDLIKYVDEVSGNTITNKPVNIDWAKIMGLELIVNYTPFDFLTLSGKCDFKFEQNETTNTGTAYSLGGYNIESTYRIAGIIKMPFNTTVGLNGDYINYNKDYRGRDVKPYFLLSGRITQKINDNFEVYLQVENMLDNKEYVSVANYPMPGREFLTGLKMEF